MKKMSLGTSPSGVESQIWVGESEIVTLQQQDAQPILDNNHRLRSAGGGRQRGLHHVASIPVTMYHEWRKEWRNNHSDKWEWKTFLAMRIRDRDYSKFRTSDAKI